MADLPNDTQTLKENIEQLLEENTQLKTENAQLKAWYGGQTAVSFAHA